MTSSVALTLNERTYRLYTPSGIGANAPLVIVLHPGLSNASRFEQDSSTLDNTLNTQADSDKFYVCYPAGVEAPPGKGEKTWNAGWCCGYANTVKSTDIQFLKLLITQLQLDQSIDPARIYLFGYSNGAMLSYSYMCTYPADIAGFVVCAGSLVLDDDDLAPAINITGVHINGTIDTNVPPAGGKGTGVSGIVFQPLSTALSKLTNKGMTIQHIELVSCDHEFAHIKTFLSQQEGLTMAQLVHNMVTS